MIRTSVLSWHGAPILISVWTELARLQDGVLCSTGPREESKRHSGQKLEKGRSENDAVSSSAILAAPPS